MTFDNDQFERSVEDIFRSIENEKTKLLGRRIDNIVRNEHNYEKFKNLPRGFVLALVKNYFINKIKECTGTSNVQTYANIAGISKELFPTEEDKYKDLINALADDLKNNRKQDQTFVGKLALNDQAKKKREIVDLTGDEEDTHNPRKKIKLEPSVRLK